MDTDFTRSVGAPGSAYVAVTDASRSGVTAALRN